MKRLICTAAMATAISGAGGRALAQQYPGSYYGSGSYYNSGPGYAPSPVTRQREDRALFDRTRMDLDRAAGYQYASHSDRKRFDDARRELFDFESRFDQGRYDTHILNRTIDRIDSVVSHNSLDPRDRGALSEDLRRLRDYRQFRAHNPGDFDGVYGYR